MEEKTKKNTRRAKSHPFQRRTLFSDVVQNRMNHCNSEIEQKQVASVESVVFVPSSRAKPQK